MSSFTYTSLLTPRFLAIFLAIFLAPPATIFRHRLCSVVTARCRMHEGFMAANPSILLIEDSPGECELFRAALKEAGLAVSLHTEADGQAAFHFLRQSSGMESLLSLILLDLKLGNQQGLDFLRRLRLDTRLKHVPVVVFTTSDDPIDLTACYAAGANGYVIKPGTYETLIRLIHDLCRYWIEWNRAPSFIETRS